MAARIECPACRSARVEPLRRVPVPGGAALCGLRCAECASCWRQELGAAAQRDLDAAQRAARAALSEAYAESVSASMASLAEALGTALQRDLLGPEDFDPRPPALS